MTRKKVKLAFIINDSARKATFKKRKRGLIKKVSELSTLCGIDACAIIYSPYESQPELWPNVMGVQRVIGQFKRMPEMEQTKKMMNQESYTRQRITKVSELLKKQQKENRELEITELMFQCLTGKGLQNVNLHDLNDLGWILDHKLKEIKKRHESLRKAAHHDQQVAQPLPQTNPPPPPPHMMQMQMQMGHNQGMMTTREVMNGLITHNLSLDLGMTRGFEHEPSSNHGLDLDMARGFDHETPSNPGLGLSMNVMQIPRPHDWSADWVNKPHDHMGFGNGYGGHGHGHEGEMMMPFNNNHHNSNWHHDFFP